MDEVAKIGNEQVRGYYQQAMRQRVYYELGKGSWTPSYAKKNNGGRQTGAAVRVEKVRPKTSLDELIVKFVLAAMVYYPELVAEYEEKMAMFAMPNPGLQTLLDNMVAVFNEHDGDEAFGSAVMIAELEEKGLRKELNLLWELKMLQMQKPDICDVRQEIDTKLTEVQIRQLENEIKECLAGLENAESFSDEEYARYQNLKKERQELIAACNGDE